MLGSIRCSLCFVALLTTASLHVHSQVAVSTVLSFSSTDGYGATVPVQIRDGNFVATTYASATPQDSVFKMTPNGQRTTLSLWSVGARGSFYGRLSYQLTLASDGNYYGTVTNKQDNLGTVDAGELFKLTPNGTRTLLHAFNGTTDGGYPTSAPIEASDGNLYGVAHGLFYTDVSTIYKYTRGGVFSIIYTTTHDTGTGCDRVIQGNDGNLYTACSAGGSNYHFYGNGTILKLSTAGTVLQTYKLAGGASGVSPSLLINGPDGDIYGSAYGAGIGQGVLFRFTPQGQYTVIHTFGQTQGAAQYGAVTEVGSDGNLYGTAGFGGANGSGTIFEYNLSTNTYTDLYSFTSAIGNDPTSLVQRTTGLFYGAFALGGANGYGGIFSANLGLAPFVRTVESSSSVGKVVEILGQGFTGTTSVTFNGVAASSFTVSSDTYLTAVVPAGATTGSIVVTSPTQSLTSNIPLTVR